MTTREVIRVAADRALARSPFQLLARGLSSTRLSILTYHAISSREVFGRHLEIIERYAVPVSLQDVISAMKGTSRLPKHAVLITFDDNDRSIVDTALPLLVEREFPAVVFVIAGLLDRDAEPWFAEVDNLVAAGARAEGLNGHSSLAMKRAMKRMPDAQRAMLLEELRASTGKRSSPTPQLSTKDLTMLESNGVEIGSHSMSHPCLPRCSVEKIEWELQEAKRIIEETLGHPPSAVAYPNGDCDERVVAVARRIGYEIGFLFDHRKAQTPTTDPFRVSRLRIDSVASPERVRIVLSGLHPAFYAARMAATRVLRGPLRLLART